MHLLIIVIFIYHISNLKKRWGDNNNDVHNFRKKGDAMAKIPRKDYWTNSGKPCPCCGEFMYQYFGERLTRTFRCLKCDQIYMTFQGELMKFEEWADLIKGV